MDPTWRRRLTDAVTLARVPIAVSLLVTRRRRATVTFGFLLGVATDAVDGPLARRWGTASERGARLDGAADAVFVAASAMAAASTVERPARGFVLRAASFVAVTRLAVLLLTRRRFGRWEIMHTHLNKAVGAGLAAVTAVALPRGRMPLAALGLVAVLAEMAALEEIAIVSRAAEYDPDCAGFCRSSQLRP